MHLTEWLLQIKSHASCQGVGIVVRDVSTALKARLLGTLVPASQ